MDDLLREFLTETGESLDVVDVELVRFEQEPNNTKILDNIFRLVHTIKGTCGFLGLPRLEALTHAAETLMGNFRGGNKAVTGEAVTLGDHRPHQGAARRARAQSGGAGGQ
jgi:two-component system, chemotaxis family, sensor kinase CheA